MDAIALSSDRGQRVAEDPDGHLLLATAEPVAEASRRIALFIDQRIGAWLASLD